MSTQHLVQDERIISTFLSLIQIDSPSRDEETIGKHLIDQLSALGCQVKQDHVGNIIARKPGRREGVILLSSHMDTVGDDRGIEPVIRDGIIYSAGPTILGADDKSGIAVILEAITILHDNPDLVHPSLEIVISVGEELGLWGVKQLELSQLRASWGIVMDSGGPIGTIVYTAPAQNYVDILFQGKKAHAGSEPEKGVNAIRIASEAISAMSLGRIDNETTSNIGVIHGGKATNIVPDRVEVRGEVRSRDEGKLAQYTAAMIQACDDAAARYAMPVETTVRSAYPTYCTTEDQAPYQAAMAALSSLGFPILPKAAGGGTDGNIFSTAGIPCVVLSTGMADVHTTAEHIAIQDLIDSARVLVTLLTSSPTRPRLAAS